MLDLARWSWWSCGGSKFWDGPGRGWAEPACWTSVAGGEAKKPAFDFPGQARQLSGAVEAQTQGSRCHQGEAENPEGEPRKRRPELQAPWQLCPSRAGVLPGPPGPSETPAPKSSSPAPAAGGGFQASARRGPPRPQLSSPEDLR